MPIRQGIGAEAIIPRRAQVDGILSQRSTGNEKQQEKTGKDSFHEISSSCHGQQMDVYFMEVLRHLIIASGECPHQSVRHFFTFITFINA